MSINGLVLQLTEEKSRLLRKRSMKSNGIHIIVKTDKPNQTLAKSKILNNN